MPPRGRRPSWWRQAAESLVLLLALGGAGPVLAQTQTSTQTQPGTDAAQAGGPIRLRTSPGVNAPGDRTTLQRNGERQSAPLPRALEPEEFEAYVTQQAGLMPVRQQDTGQFEPDFIRRLGSELVRSLATHDDAEDSLPQVPADYIVSPGDELQLLLWGSVDAELRLTVDRAGRISVPRIGAIMVAGSRYADLQELISKRAAQVFKNFQLSVSLGRLRSVKVYVTGHVRRPGAYSVSALSTMVAAVMRAGGPSVSGSFRKLQLRRTGAAPADFDLYDLMLRGDKAADRLVQVDDVIYVGPVGPQVAVIGSVARPQIVEVKAGETLGDVLAMAGGFTSVADTSRLTIERLDDRRSQRIVQLDWPAAAGQAPRSGDLLRAYSAVSAALPVSRQNKRVRIEGEVLRPGEYIVPADARMHAVVELAGGLTEHAYVYGTEFSRESVRIVQQSNYERALRDLETDFAKSAGSQRAIDAQDAAAQAAQASATSKLIERLRAIKPSGRVVLQLQPQSRALPDLALEDGDNIHVPALPTTVGVFGSVFSGGSFLLESGRRVGDFVGLAGGPTRGADEASTFVVRANGSVVSQPQKAGFLGLGKGLASEDAFPGDTIFVPEEIGKTTWTQSLKEWTQIFYQFGLGAAAIRTFSN